MARNPSALIWITHKASEVQRKHKNMKWKSAIKEAATQYRKKHGTKKVAKKNLEKEKGTHKYSTCKNQTQVKFKFACNHDKQCSICSYEGPILEFGLRQEMA